MIEALLALSVLLQAWSIAQPAKQWVCVTNGNTQVCEWVAKESTP